MGKFDWKNLDDDELELVLEDSLDENVMEDVVAQVTPCKWVMAFILIGMALRTFTFDFFNLNYILPFAGIIISLIGYRRLKNENMWFWFDYIFIWLRAVYTLFLLIMNTVIIHSSGYMVSFMNVLGGVFIGVSFAEVACLWLGIRAVQKKAGLEPKAYSAGILLGCEVVLTYLALIKYRGSLLMLAFVGVYVLLFYNMYKLSKELDVAGYAVSTKRVRIPDCFIAIALAVVLIVGGTCGYIFGNRYYMEWTMAESVYVGNNAGGGIADTENSSTTSDILRIAQNLIEQGFPEYVIMDLKAEEIAACDGALRVVTNVEENEYGLEFTDVAVQIPDEEEKWVIFHHYRWTKNKKFYGTELVQVWTTYRDNPRGWAAAENIGVSGRILYDKDGVTYTSPYRSLETRTYRSDNIFYGSRTLTDIFGTFSFPVSGQNCRGYVMYSAVHIDTSCVFTSFLNYTHQQSLRQYPVKTAYESRTTSWFEHRTFRTIQNYWFMYNTMENQE